MSGSAFMAVGGSSVELNTYIYCNHKSLPGSVGLAQARPNYIKSYNCGGPNLLREEI